MKKPFALLLLAVICICCFVGCGTRSPAGVRIDYGESTIYIREEMDEAIRIIQQKFGTDAWKGCELHSISYGGDEACNEKNLMWMNELEAANDAKEHFTRCIMFTSSFHSPKRYNGGGLNTDQEYTGWGWWLARSDGGEWKLMTWGYA